jgi:predicted DNA-binding transcriptional regulator YafY
MTLQGSIARYNWIRRTLLSGVNLNCVEIAERLECTTKTAQRYINRLRADGYSVIYDHKLNGYIIQEPRKKKIEIDEIYRVLRRAYSWANKNHKDAPWLPAAERILKKIK